MKMHCRGSTTALILIALVAPMSVSAVFAESAPPSSGVPDSLVLEVMTAAGYEWMKSCLPAGGLDASPEGGRSPVGVDQHASHHPDQGEPAVSPLGGADIAQAIRELRMTIEALEKALSRRERGAFQ